MEWLYWEPFFLGLFSFFCIDESGHALISFFVGLLFWLVLLGWLIWIIYAFAAPGIVRKKWISRGYIEE